MKKLFLIILTLIICFVCNGQYTVPRGIPQTNTAPYYWFKAPGGFVVIDSTLMFNDNSDTTMKPTYTAIKFFNNVPYYWDLIKWNAFGSGGGSVNIYNSDGTITDPLRTVNIDGNILNFNNGFVGIDQPASTHTLELGQGGGTLATFQQNFGSNGNDAVWYSYPLDANILRINGDDQATLLNEGNTSWKTIIGGVGGDYPFTIRQTGTNGGGYGTIQAGIQNSDTEVGMQLDNLGTGGRSYNFFSTNDGSGVGGGNFIIADATAGASRFKIASTGAITFDQAYTFPITDGTANYILKTDGSGNVSWQADGSGLDSVKAYNGLTAAGADSVKLGGTLVENTNIDASGGDYYLSVLGDAGNSAHIFQVGGGTRGIYSQGTTLGLLASSATSPFKSLNITATTNADAISLDLTVAPNTGAAGLGSYINTTLVNASGSAVPASRVTTRLTNATNGAESASYIVNLVNNGVSHDVLSIASTGATTIPELGGNGNRVVWNDNNGLLYNATMQVLSDSLNPYLTSLQNGCISGCVVTWDTLYTYIISPSVYRIGGIVYSSPADTVTLAAADPTFNREDAFVVNTSGTNAVVQGTAANPALFPDIDEASQLQISFATVFANTTSPTDLDTLVIYKENTGPPAEWTYSDNTANLNPASTNNPYNGVVDIEGTTVALNNFFALTVSPSPTFPNYTQLNFKIRSKAAWAVNRILTLRFFTAGGPVGTPVTFTQGSYGFNSSNTTDYQNVSISLADFGNITGATALRFTRSGTTGSNIGFYIDNIILLNGPLQGNGNGIQAITATAPITATTVGSATNIALTTPLSATFGGTGQNSSAWAQGDLPYISATGTWNHLAKDANATRYLSNQGTNNSPSWNQVNLANGVTGTLPVTNGGTGQTTFTNGQLLIGNTTGNTLTKSTLTAGSGISITNSTGSITIAANGTVGTDTVNVSNVLSFGADSTNTISSTAAINNAKAQAAADGKMKVYIPHGHYRVDISALKSGSQTNKQGIELVDNIEIYGDGIGKTVIEVIGNTTGDTTTTNWYPVFNGFNGVNNVKIHDLSINGNQDSINIYSANPYANPTGHGDTSKHQSVQGIYFKGGTNNEVYNVRIDSCQGFGIEYYISTNAYLHHSIFTTDGNGAVGFSSNSTTVGSSGTMENCTAVNNNSDQLRILNGNGQINILNNFFGYAQANVSSPTWYAGIYIHNSFNVLVKGNRVTNNSGYGIDWGGPDSTYTGNTIEDNYVWRNANGAIDIAGGSVKVINNWLFKNGITDAGLVDTHSNYNPGAIVVNNSTHCIITGNHAFDSTGGVQAYFIKTFGGTPTASFGIRESIISNNWASYIADTTHFFNLNSGVSLQNIWLHNQARTSADVIVPMATDNSLLTMVSGVEQWTTVPIFGSVLFNGSSPNGNIITVGSTSSGAVDNTMSFIVAGLGSSTTSSNGPYTIFRGNNYSFSANQRGNIYIEAGNPSSPAATEGQITFGTGSNTARLVITNDGRIYGTALHNNAGSVTGTTNQYIASGTYTPTLTNVANVAASTAYLCQWTRIGNVVTVSGKVDIDATTTLTLTQLGISLPIASNIANNQNCAGTANVGSLAGSAGAILGDATNDRAEIDVTPTSVTNDSFYFTFTYTIL